MLVEDYAVGTEFLAGMPFVCLHSRDGDARNLNSKQISLL